MIERIKVQIEILKIKILFFIGVVGGVGFIAIHFFTLKKVVPVWILWAALVVLILYGMLGIMYNLKQLNGKYEELENE